MYGVIVGRDECAARDGVVVVERYAVYRDADAVDRKAPKNTSPGKYAFTIFGSMIRRITPKETSSSGILPSKPKRTVKPCCKP